MAPEILQISGSGYNPEQTDVFSLGVILFNMFIGKPPFRTADFKTDELYKMIVEHRFSEFWRIWDEQYLEPNGINLSHELKSIFTSMICSEPCHRLSI